MNSQETLEITLLGLLVWAVVGLMYRKLVKVVFRTTDRGQWEFWRQNPYSQPSFGKVRWWVGDLLLG